MEIRIGIANSRELSFETDQTADVVEKAIVSALDAKATHVTLADARGTTYVVPTSGIAFVEIGTEESRRVGFVA